ncbi:MAG: hypothetical protein HY901_10570 [Deltaproteobacteria bacterium]|nr:hypothetical protein [Deltaproteobacteria bacterium]
MVRPALVLVTFLAAAPVTAASPEVERIRAAIREQGLSWEAGETSVTRMSPAQRAGLRLPPGAIPPWVHALGGYRPARPPPPRPSLRSLPASIDWRNREGFNLLPPARDQGDCGSCWAFATIGALEGVMTIRRSEANSSLDLSEQNLLDCAAASLGCAVGGTTWVMAENYMKNTGVTTEACYPYASGATGEKGSCTAPTGTCASEIVRSEDSAPLYSTTPSSPWNPPPYMPSQEVMDEIKTYLQERPVGTSMRAYDDLSAYTSGIYEPINTTQGSALHAVVIVGYDDVGSYWIVRNSWGSDDWGEDGYFRVRYGASSVGMFSFVYMYDEANKDPAFCPDLPTSLELHGTSPVNLKIANCGSAVLSWQAQLSPAWLKLAEGSGQAVTSGAVVAAGTTYKVSATQALPAGGSGQIVLTGAPNGPKTIDVTVRSMPPDAAMAGPDAAPAGPDAAPGGADVGVTAADASTSGSSDASTTSSQDAGMTSSWDASAAVVADASDAQEEGDGEEQSGCGCAASSALPAGGLAWLAVLATLRRRRG